MANTTGKKFGGRKKGSLNKKTKEWDDIGEYISTHGAAKYMCILKEIEGKDYMERFEKVLEYFKPKLGRTEHTGKDGGDLVVNANHYGDRTSV